MINFGSIFSRKKKSHFYIVLDVGTYSVRSLAVEYGPDGAIGLKKIVSLLPPKEGGLGLATKIGVRLREIIFRHIKELGKIPDEVIHPSYSWGVTELPFDSIFKLLPAGSNK